MRATIFTILGMLYFLPVLFGQTGHVQLYVQSPDGKNVKLVWFVKSVSNDVAGFDIKRKEGLQDWVKLNSEPIIPGVSMKRNFAALGANKDEESKLKARLFKLLANHKLKETEPQFLQRLSNDERLQLQLSKTIAEDYEKALMYGFAFLDHTVTNKTDYQYGLFEQSSNKLIADVSWNYGEIPDLNTVLEITSKSTIGSSGVMVIWNANMDKANAAKVAGFNIYRQGIRLNLHPITAADKNNPGEFLWADKSANSAIPIQYSISAESIFGIEGIIRSYTYDPADHPTEYRKTEVTEISSLGYYFKDGIGIKWNFPKEHERFLKGFYVEKDNMPNGYKRVSGLLEPGDRMFIDKSPSPISVYIKFHVIAVYKDKTEIPGSERLYTYFPVNEPPVPSHPRAEILATNKKNVVNISWDKKLAGDSTTDHYKVYVAEPGENQYSVVNDDQPLVANTYLFGVPEGIAGIYKFCITAVSKSGVESSASDTVSVLTKSSELPEPIITKTKVDSNRLIVQWQYKEVSDLKGFRLYKNYKVIATEKELKKNTREYVVTGAEPGSNITIAVLAVSESGVISELSAPVVVQVPTGE